MLKVYGLIVGNGRTVWARPRDVQWTVLSRSPRSTRSLHPPRSATRARLETLIPINRGRKIPTLTPLIVTGTNSSNSFGGQVSRFISRSSPKDVPMGPLGQA
jgi:hypothetical protein